MKTLFRFQLLFLMLFGLFGLFGVVEARAAACVTCHVPCPDVITAPAVKAAKEIPVERLAPRAPESLRLAIAQALPEFGITTRLRVAHWFSQMGHESGSFRFSREIWKPTPAQRRYEFARRLGNTQPGDGFRFRGRGIIQLTGRYNYTDFSKRLELDLVRNPDLAAEPPNSARIACVYWDSRSLNRLADRDDARAITKRINGGFNGFQDRLYRLRQAKAVLRQFNF